MPIAALAIGGIGSIVGGVMGANAANNAANTQANAANSAANLQYQLGQQGLDFQKQQWQQQQQNIAPWLQAGGGAVGSLANLLGINMPGQTPTSLPPNWPNPGQPFNGGMGNPQTPVNNPNNLGGFLTMNAQNAVAGNAQNPLQGVGGLPPGASPMVSNPGAAQNPNLPPAGINSPIMMSGGPAAVQGNVTNPGMPGFGSLLQGWDQPFNAPTAATEQNDPGYQFRLQEGQKALENSAAARGGILSGGTGKALQQYGQDYASNEYGNVYNRALGQYQQAYNIFNNNQTNLYNRLAGLAGMGQTAATNLNSVGQAGANNAGNILLGTGSQVGQNINNAGSARASGYVGAANSYNNMLGNLLGAVTQFQNG